MHACPSSFSRFGFLHLKLEKCNSVSVLPIKKGEKALISIDRTNKECRLKDQRSGFIVKKNYGLGGLYEFFSEMGQATCRVGRVENLTIDKNAENCGLDEALTALCFLDQDINGDGRTLEQILNYNPAIGKMLSEDKKSWIEEHFQNLIYTPPNNGLDKMISTMRGALAAGYTHVLFVVSSTALRLTSVNDYVGMC